MGQNHLILPVFEIFEKKSDQEQKVLNAVNSLVDNTEVIIFKKQVNTDR